MRLLRAPRPEIERRLVELSIDELTAERARCSDCGRTPLIGEDLHLYDAGEIVCELCRQLRHEPPAQTARVRHSEFAPAVHVRRLTPASPPRPAREHAPLARTWAASVPLPREPPR